MIRVRGPLGTFRALLGPGESAPRREDPGPLGEAPGQTAGISERDPGQGAWHVE